MIPSMAGVDPSSCLSGCAGSAEGAGPASDGSLPGAVDISFHDLLRSLNPLQHLPVVGTFYRAATGDEIPHPLRILGATLVGGPIGGLGSALFGLVTELIGMGPDHSRPPVPAGFAMAGSEAGMQPVSPGTLGKGEYTTLATTEPAFIEASEKALLAEGAARALPASVAGAYTKVADTFVPQGGMA